MKTITVVAPVLNEEKIIKDFYERLSGVLGDIKRYSFKILFVVGRSSDKTLEILKEISKGDGDVRIISLSGIGGHQVQLLAGIDHSDSDAIIMMDSDLQHPPEVIPKLLAEFENGMDVVYTIREKTIGQNLFRRWSSELFYKFLNLISDVPISSKAADFRLISGRVGSIIRNDIRERNLFLRGIFSWIGFNQSCVRFIAEPRRAGESKYSISRLISFGLSGVVSFSRKPLRICIGLGSIIGFFGLAYALFTVMQFVFWGNLPSGYATIVVLLSVFSGFHLFFLGVVGEYIGAIFEEVKKRPHYFIDEKINF